MTSIAKKKKSKVQYSLNDKLFVGFVYAALILVTFLCFYPLYYTVIASFSNAHDVYTGKVSFLPSGFTVKAYTAVFTNNSIWRGYANTVFYTFFGTCFNLILTIPAAYALSKQRLFGRGLLTTLFIITMYFSGGMIPTYLLYKSYHLINTRWVLVISGGLSVYNMIVTRTYFQNNIPETLCEAARIDGANELYIFWRLVLPLSAPILAVITLYYGVAHWGSYFNAMIYQTDQTLQPLQLVLRRILILNENAMQEALSADNSALIADAVEKQHLAVTMKFALVFIASLPMLVAYPFIQRYFVKGIMIGSLKG